MCFNSLIDNKVRIIQFLGLFNFEQKVFVFGLPYLELHRGFFEGRIFDFIRHEDILLGFGDDELIVSYDEGSSWEILTSGFPLELRPWQQKGFSLNDRLLIWDTYDITQIKFTDVGLDVISFCTEGLDPGPGRYIHRLIMTAEYMFVGTQNGLYYKPLDDFWESARE